MLFENRIQFISLSSGSNGNCYCISNGKVSLLIDAGIGCRTVKKRLAEYGVSLDDVAAVFITHDHIDHIRHLSVLMERFGKPIYTTQPVHIALDRHPCTKGCMSGYRKIIAKGEPCNINGVMVTPFEVQHDASDTVGYHIEFGEEKFTLITDIGVVTDIVEEYCRKANHLIIEANYDKAMLENGAYPQYLKSRIKDGFGHLSNDSTAKTVKRVYHKDMRNILLCHLSENNNTPELAYMAVSEALGDVGAMEGSDVTLHILPRRSSYRIFAN